MLQFRVKLQRGGCPILVLTERSSLEKPEWYLLVQDASNEIWRVTTPTQRTIQTLGSVQKIYQIARQAGLGGITIPIDQDRVDITAADTPRMPKGRV